MRPPPVQTGRPSRVRSASAESRRTRAGDLLGAIQGAHHVNVGVLQGIAATNRRFESQNSFAVCGISQAFWHVAALAWQNLRRLSRPQGPTGKEAGATPRERHRRPTLPLACDSSGPGRPERGYRNSSRASVRLGSPETTAPTGSSSAPVDRPRRCAPLPCMETSSHPTASSRDARAFVSLLQPTGLLTASSSPRSSRGQLVRPPSVTRACRWAGVCMPAGVVAVVIAAGVGHWLVCGCRTAPHPRRGAASGRASSHRQLRPHRDRGPGWPRNPGCRAAVVPRRPLPPHRNWRIRVR